MARRASPRSAESRAPFAGKLAGKSAALRDKALPRRDKGAAGGGAAGHPSMDVRYRSQAMAYSVRIRSTSFGGQPAR